MFGWTAFTHLQEEVGFDQVENSFGIGDYAELEMLLADGGLGLGFEQVRHFLTVVLAERDLP
jgi:hypothetical protein